jgi:hypothetical protein
MYKTAAGSVFLHPMVDEASPPAVACPNDGGENASCEDAEESGFGDVRRAAETLLHLVFEAATSRCSRRLPASG